MTVTVPGPTPVAPDAVPGTSAEAAPLAPANADVPANAQTERCTALPATRPPGLVFRYWQKIHPPAPGVEVHGPGTPCPRTVGPKTDFPLPCTEVPEATLDALFSMFKQHGIDRIKPMQKRPSAHRSWRTLEVIWGDHFCVLSENSSWAVPESAKKDFAALIDAVVKAAP
jgi:hypothetical protein